MIAGITVSALTSGLATRLLTSGIQRIGTLTFQKAMRISRIESSIKNISIKNANAKIATDDFITLIGNRYGQYTQQLATFLEELERSGLITAMVENALLDRKSADVQQSFTFLHSKVISDKVEDASELYEKIMASFTVTFREISKDKIAHGILQLVHRDISARLDQLDQALQTINKSQLGERPTSLLDLQPALLKIARGLLAVTKQVRVETNKGARSVDISKIYIPPKLKYRDTKKNSESLAKAAAAIRHKRNTRSDTQELAEWRVDPSILNTIGYGDLKLSFSRVVILGDPGGGKSTICQNLCFDLAKQAASALLTSNKPSAQLQKFPIRIVLRSFEKARTVDPQLSLLDFINRDLNNYVSLEPSELRDTTLYLLKTGAAVLAFDGLDEILATAQRREFVDLVVSFCNQFPLCPTIVTSRLVGYDSAPLTSDFEELVLERFDQNEILSYLSKFFKVVGGRSETEAFQFAQDFLRQTASNAADLRTNPLMLGLMAWLFNARGDVPSNRPEIYRECAILMFERWDPDRDIKADVPADFDKLHLFSNLASKIFGDPELAAGVETSWLTDKIRDYLEALYENRSQAAAGTKAVVKFITGCAWVMTDVGDGIFAFTHQTFLEYFFARHIDEKADTVEEVLREIIPHVVLREWDVVAHLSLQIKTHRSLRRQNQSIEQLIRLLDSATPIDERRALNLFAARALEYLNASESKVKALVERIFSESINDIGDEKSFLAVLLCAQCCAERRKFVRKVLLELIIEVFRTNVPHQIENLAKVMSSTRVRGGIQDSAMPFELQSDARAAVSQIVIDRAGVSELSARLAWSWYGNISESLLQRHGLWTFFNASLEGDYYFVDAFTLLVLGATDSYRADFILPRDKALLGMEAIGRVGFTGGPLDKSKFDRTLITNGPPLHFWKHLLNQYKKTPDALAGAFFIFLLVSELASENVPENDRADQKISHESLIQSVLSSRTFKKVALYPEIARVVKHGSLFEEDQSSANQLPIAISSPTTTDVLS